MSKPLKYLTTTAVEGVKKVSKKAPKIDRYPTPKAWQQPEALPELLIDLASGADGFNPNSFVQPPGPTLGYLGYVFAIKLAIFLAGYYYPTIAKAVSNRVTQFRRLYKATKVRNWRQSVIKGRVSTRVLPLADYSVRACASHPLMREYIIKKCSKPEFQTFFNNFSSLYNKEYASREIVKMYIFCAEFYSQHDMVRNGITILKRPKISLKELFRVWKDLRAMLVVCQPCFLPSESGWAEWWNRFYIRRFPVPFSSPDLIRVRQGMSQDLKDQMIDVEKHHNKITTWNWYCDHSVTTDVMLKILWFFGTNEAQMIRVPPRLRTSNRNMPLLTEKQWQQHRVYEFVYYMRCDPPSRKGRIRVNSIIHRWLVDKEYINEPLDFRPPGKIWKVSLKNPRPINWLEWMKIK